MREKGNGPESITELIDNNAVVDCQELRVQVWAGSTPENVRSRALLWQLLLSCLPQDKILWEETLSKWRTDYAEIVREISKHPADSAPDGDHPLSLEQDSHWAHFFNMREAEKLIDLDVKRTHPAISEFRRLEGPMHRILLAYSLKHQEIGYRQGMNELLAPLIYIYSEVPGIKPIDAEADAYHSLATVMKEMSRYYTPSLAELHKELDLLDDTLRLRDPELHRYLTSLSIQPQLYGTRWIRLWLTQEFSLQQTLILWDSILSVHPRMPWIRSICSSMVVAVRDKLLGADFNTAAQTLLRYSNNNVDVELVLKLAHAFRTGSSIQEIMSRR
uniref:Rab-GAP TBC domain-containing protein n=1 Tax=Rhodosorus marinus TaxID=101924 RepID=A0A7S3A481_9RHOD|mmetsp:Transcript_42057/g.164697  ORF Transcript_42057/g.164697 Transcript_42057/m.164697 type:complete len:331 (+) Transcript_42057:73-1065(+)